MVAVVLHQVQLQDDVQCRSECQASAPPLNEAHTVSSKGVRLELRRLPHGIEIHRNERLYDEVLSPRHSGRIRLETLQQDDLHQSREVLVGDEPLVPPLDVIAALPGLQRLQSRSEGTRREPLLAREREFCLDFQSKLATMINAVVLLEEVLRCSGVAEDLLQELQGLGPPRN